MPINITMPALSPTMTEGNLAKWHKKEGDTIKAGEVIAEIETDKATMEVEAVDEGVLGKIIIAAGTQNVAVNSVIGVLLEEGESASDIKQGVILSEAKNPEPQAQKKDPSSPKAPQDDIKKEPQKGDRIYASPLAKRLAVEKGIDLSRITGSGPHGRIVKADLENAKGGAPAGRPAVIPTENRFKEIPNNNIKKITAKRLLESKTSIPHFYLTVDFRIDALLDARRQINDAANGAYKLSVNDFVIKAVAMALRDFPAANVAWTDEAVLQYENADISVAVATPNGLITPIVRAAELKSLRSISEEVKDLAGRAREGKLKPQEFQGGTFTISNLGMFGIKDFAAIINPPQSCILAVGAGIEQPVVDNGQIKVGTIMSCTLSTDHRSVDGAVGAEFLQILRKYIENPISMMVEI